MKKLKMLLLVVCLLCFSAYSLEPVLQPDFIKPDTTELNLNLDKLEQNWNQLIIENMNLKAALEKSEQSQEKQWNMYQENMTYYSNLEIQYKKSEHKLMIWRGIAVASSCISIALGTVLLIKENK